MAYVSFGALLLGFTALWGWVGARLSFDSSSYNYVFGRPEAFRDVAPLLFRCYSLCFLFTSCLVKIDLCVRVGDEGCWYLLWVGVDKYDAHVNPPMMKGKSVKHFPCCAVLYLI